MKEKLKRIFEKISKKIVPIFDILVFILLFIIALPVLFITGGIVRPFRYVLFVKDKVNNKTPRKYDF